MKIEIIYEKSNKIVDAVVKIDEPNCEKIFWKEEISFVTPNDSQENINVWLSEERKREFEQKLNKADTEHTYKVVEIKVSK